MGDLLTARPVEPGETGVETIERAEQFCVHCHVWETAAEPLGVLEKGEDGPVDQKPGDLGQPLLTEESGHGRTTIGGQTVAQPGRVCGEPLRPVVSPRLLPAPYKPKVVLRGPAVTILSVPKV